MVTNSKLDDLYMTLISVNVENIDEAEIEIHKKLGLLVLTNSGMENEGYRKGFRIAAAFTWVFLALILTNYLSAIIFH